MTNKNVYLKKLKLDERFLNDSKILLLLNKPGTLSKREKDWLKAYTSMLDLKSASQHKIDNKRLSNDFIRMLEKERR